MKTVLAIFNNKTDADLAVSHLTQLGHRAKNMSFILKDDTYQSERGSKGGAAAGMGGGAVAGGVIGGFAGLLIGIGAIAVPGIGAFLIGGPIVSALGLTGAAAATVTGVTTGVLAGGLLGGLVSLGIPEETAKAYEQKVREGGVLLAVPIMQEEDYDRVHEVLENYRANQIRVINDSPIFG